MMQAKRQYLRRKRKVQAQLQQLQKQRQEQLIPSSLYLPAPWQPVMFSQPTTMYKVVAAQDGKFLSVFDRQVQYTPKQWTHARYGCRGAWPPLWSCMYVYPTAAQAKSTVFPQGSQHKKGARVLVKVQVAGKGYINPADGRVAVSSLLMDEVLAYLPKGPAEQVISMDYPTESIRPVAVHNRYAHS